MKKNLIVAAIAAALATPLVANADATMYGQLRVATQTHSRSDSQGSWGMEDQASRLGVKGDEDLGGGLKAIYKIEFGVNVGGGLAAGDITGGNLFTRTGRVANDFWTQRDTYVGLSGAFGTVLAGRSDTPMKMSTAKLDFFRDTAADNDEQNSFLPTAPFASRGVGLFDSRRVDGAIAYVSPNLAGLTVIGAAVQGNTNNAGAGYQDAQAFAGAYSLAATYSNGPWFASAAYETMDLSNFGNAFLGTNVYNKWRVGLGMLDFNNISAAFIYEGRDFGYSGGDTNSWQLQAAYDLPGNMRVKGMYGNFDGINGPANGVGILGGIPNFDTWALGVEYNLSKRTDVQMLYRAKTYDVAAPAGANDQTDDVFALQLDHSF